VLQVGGLVSMRSLPDGGQSPYELNTTFYDALSRTFKGETTITHTRFICSQTIVMSLEGIPAFYIHAMLATPNDHAQVEHRGMSRAINRHRGTIRRCATGWPMGPAPQSRVLGDLSARLKMRQKQKAFHPQCHTVYRESARRTACLACGGKVWIASSRSLRCITSVMRLLRSLLRH